jgi:hypothetical protein
LIQPLRRRDAFRFGTRARLGRLRALVGEANAVHLALTTLFLCALTARPRVALTFLGDGDLAAQLRNVLPESPDEACQFAALRFRGRARAVALLARILGIAHAGL